MHTTLSIISIGRDWEVKFSNCISTSANNLNKSGALSEYSEASRQKELEFLYILAKRFGVLLNLFETYNNLALNNYINEELEKKLETSDAFHVKVKLFKKEFFLDPQI